MLQSKHLHEEITNLSNIADDLDKSNKIYESAMLRSQVLTLKLLLNIRQNQVLELQHKGVSLVKSGKNGQEN